MVWKAWGLSIIGIVLFISIVSSTADALRMTEYDGPRIIAVHEVTPAQVLLSGEANYRAQKHGGRVLTIERARYEGFIELDQYNIFKITNAPIIEVKVFYG